MSTVIISTASSVRCVSAAQSKRRVQIGGGIVEPPDHRGSLGPVELTSPVAGSGKQVARQRDPEVLEVLLLGKTIPCERPDGTQDDEPNLDARVDTADQAGVDDLCQRAQDVGHVFAHRLDGLHGEPALEEGEAVATVRASVSSLA